MLGVLPRGDAFDNFPQAEIIWVAETLYFRYGRELDEGIDLDNVRDIDSLDKIPLTWIVAWEIDGRRGFWGQTIVKDKFKMYLELHSQWGGECAREIVNNYRKCRVVNMELTEEIDRVSLEERNEFFEDEEDRIREIRQRRSMGV